jgi:hypothetical protein
MQSAMPLAYGLRAAVGFTSALRFWRSSAGPRGLKTETTTL